MEYFKKYYIVYVLVFAAVCASALIVSQQAELIHQTMSEAEAEPVVVIDAGHGGEDGGAVSVSGVKESDLNLQISLRLNDLCTLLGIRTNLLRSEDTALYQAGAETLSQKKVSDLRHRVELINETAGGLLVSIHQNSYPESKYYGAQVFYAETEGSQELAELLQQKIGESLDTSNRRTCKKSQTVYLMEHVKCPAILLECGFLTNATEEGKLRSAEYQKQIACTVISALTEYLQPSAEDNSV